MNMDSAMADSMSNRRQICSINYMLDMAKKIMYGILSDYSRKEKKLKRIRRSTIPIGYIE